MSTRQTQPFRRSESRAPSQVLDRVLAGKGPYSKPAGKAGQGSAKRQPKLMYPVPRGK